MHHVTINDESYVKAADIARELGYTGDYVGQLCRAQKVEAQLVGRSWYVSEQSIRDHKKNRYRSTKAATAKSVKKTIHTISSEGKKGYAVPVEVNKNKTSQSAYAKESFYARAPEPKKTTYHEDGTELIPLGGLAENKTGTLSVSLAGATEVKVKTRSSIYDFDPTPRDEIRFAGSLDIEEVEDQEPIEEPKVEEEVSDFEKRVNKDKVPKKVKITTLEVEETAGSRAKKIPLEILNTKKKTVRQDEITSKLAVGQVNDTKADIDKNLPLEHNPHGVLGMRRGRISARNPAGGTLKVNVPTTNVTVVASSGPYVLFVSMILSVIIAFVTLSLESSVVIQGDGNMTTSYIFKIQELLASVYDAMQ